MHHFFVFFTFVLRLISDWSEFTSCLSTNDVTFDDMYGYLSTYQFSYERHYNGSIASYYYFCTHIGGGLSRRFLVQFN